MTALSDRHLTLKQFRNSAPNAYEQFELARLQNKISMFRSLPSEDRQILPEFEQRMSKIEHCLRINAKIITDMAQDASSIDVIPNSLDSSNHPPDSSTKQNSPLHFNNNKDTNATTNNEKEQLDHTRFLSKHVRRGMALLAKDWSADGVEQRAMFYDPLIQAVEQAYQEAARALRSLSRDKFRVLVPGAGAGRLAWELARRQFMVEGCDSSVLALLVGNYALNECAKHAITIYPFAHDHSNVQSEQQLTRGVQVPDVDPSDISLEAEFTMRAANFVDAYEGQDNRWAAVVSCMAFDLSESVIAHVRRVSQILKPGGVWAFVGPMPCFDDDGTDGVYIALNEFVSVLRKCGFKIIKQDKLQCLHSADHMSMRRVHVECSLIVAVKVRPAQ